MSNNRHIIKRQILELQGVQEQDARDLQREFSRLFKEKVVPLLDEYLTRVSPNGTRQRIESLTLDLGAIPRHDFEKVVLEQVRAQLHKHLRPVSQPLETAPAPERQPGPKPVREGEAQLELLRFFVEKGVLPWWASADEADPILKSLDYLEVKEVATLQRELTKWIQRPHAIRRLVRHLKFSRWVRLANLKLKTKPDRLTTLLAGLLEVVEFAPFSADKRQEELGIRFLSWVYLAPGTTADRPAFWKAFFLQLASAEKLNYEQWLIKAMEKMARRSGQTTAEIHPLSQLVEKLIQETALDPAPTIAPGSLLRELKHLLAGKWLRAEERSIAEQAVAQLEKGDVPREKRLEWTEWIESVKLRRPPRAEPDKGPDAAASELNELTEKSPPPPSLITRTDKTEDTPASARFSESEEIFVNNAGLVILWPFLERFFARLGLVEDKQFTGEAARHRAVGLLQHLADGQDQPAEYWCGLNKILCGLEVAAVLDFGEAVSAEEASECEQLLAAVIANAPILKEMSVEGFRGSFLLRQAILKDGSGFWRLQVEKQAFDIVLERFPWNWKHVKLPWMKEGVEVEWV